MIAVIGGTGFGELVGLSGLEEGLVETRFGPAHLQTGTLDGVPVLFLPRHGSPATIPPHRINYRANIQALCDTGADAIIAVTAVGSVDARLAVPQFVIPDQIIDYTFGRAQTFFDDEIHHIELSFPYHAALRASIIDAARLVSAATGLPLGEGGVYGCTQGPRLETAAEITRLGRDGCDIVGMTAMPEAALARERNIPYAGLSVVVNTGAGIGGQAIDLGNIEVAMTRGMDGARLVVARVIASYSAGGVFGSDSGSDSGSVSD